MRLEMAILDTKRVSMSRFINTLCEEMSKFTWTIIQEGINEE